MNGESNPKTGYSLFFSGTTHIEELPIARIRLPFLTYHLCFILPSSVSANQTYPPTVVGPTVKYLYFAPPTFITFTGIFANSVNGSKSAIDVTALVCTCSVSLFTIPSKSSCSQENIANNPTNNKLIFLISITLLG